MKKISLKNLNLKEIEKLSREQLIGVLGGYSETVNALKRRCVTGSCEIHTAGQGTIVGSCMSPSGTANGCSCYGQGQSALSSECSG